MKTNITLLLPLNVYKKKLASKIASKLNMFFVDIDEMLQFELMDIKKALSIGGKNYLDKEEDKLVARLYSYSNTLITLNLATFLKEENYEFIKKNSLIVYLEFSSENYAKLLKQEKTDDELQLNIKLFQERNKLLKKNADIIVFCENTNKQNILIELIQKINEYYTKKGK